MIKKSIIILLLNISSGMLMAQFYVGLQGGANLSKMDFTNNQDYRFTEIDFQQGFTAGLVLQFLGEKHAGVQAEFNYSRRGWVENDTTGAEYLKYRNTMDYLEMPILSHINIGGGRFRGIFNIGPYLGYALNRKITTENVDRDTEQTEDYVFESKRDNQFDFGLLVGGGIEYRFDFGKISAEARYTIGLGDINKQKVFQSELSQFRIISVLVRYTLPVIKRAATPEAIVQ